MSEKLKDRMQIVKRINVDSRNAVLVLKDKKYNTLSIETHYTKEGEISEVSNGEFFRNSEKLKLLSSFPVNELDVQNVIDGKVDWLQQIELIKVGCDVAISTQYENLKGK